MIMEDDYISRLNDKQREAALHLNGPALVLAGPGSGKTSVITARAISLVKKHDVSPGRILTVTFSNAAAEEMRKRYIKVSGENNIPVKEIPEYSTIHSFCYRTLKKNGALPQKIKVLSDGNIKQEMLRKIWKKINSPKEENLTTEFLELISNAISKMKCFSGSEKEEAIRKEIQIRNFGAVFTEYEHCKVRHGYIDFDDMISLFAAHLAKNEVFCRKIVSMYDFIQIDEGKDMSFSQIEIVKHIGSRGNVFMVADDDQGIYGFRGADVGALNYFERSFKGCQRYYLEQNYRSVKSIVKVSTGFISKNSERYNKKIFTLNEDGLRVEILRTCDVYEQARFAAEIALETSAAGMTCGILYRRNISAMLPLTALYAEARRKGSIVAAGIAGGFNSPDKYEPVNYFIEKLKYEEQKNRPIIKSPYAVYLDIEKSGKFKEFREMSAIRGVSDKDTEYILCFVTVLCKLFKSFSEIDVFFNGIKLLDSEPSIFFSTVHSAKGLEYDCVVIIDASDDEFPKKTACEKSDIEEERRLFYVAMTRAKKKLYIVSPDKCGRIECMPGLFFRETAEVLKA